MNKHADHKKKLIDGVIDVVTDFFYGVKRGIYLIISIPLFILLICFFIFLILIIVCFLKMVILGDWTMTDFKNNILNYLFAQLELFYLPIWQWIVSLLKRLFSYIII